MEAREPWRCKVCIAGVGPGQVQVGWFWAHDYRYASGGSWWAVAVEANMQMGALRLLRARIAGAKSVAIDRAVLIEWSISQTVSRAVGL